MFISKDEEQLLLATPLQRGSPGGERCCVTWGVTCLQAAKGLIKSTLCLLQIRKTWCKWYQIRFYAPHGLGFILDDAGPRTCFPTSYRPAGPWRGAGTAATQLQHIVGRDQGQEKKAGPWEAGQPLLRSLPAPSLKATSCTISKLALSPGDWPPRSSWVLSRICFIYPASDLLLSAMDSWHQLPFPPTCCDLQHCLHLAHAIADLGARQKTFFATRSAVLPSVAFHLHKQVVLWAYDAIWTAVLSAGSRKCIYNLDWC